MPQLPQIDELLKTATDRGDVPGVVAMAATRAGPVYQGAFGRRGLPDGAAMTADTVFWIASMTKAITSTAAMQLVEQGKLTLDGPIAGVLPELATPQVLSRRAAALSGTAADHLAPPDHPHRRLCLRHMER
jgi:methyl acetate hydrolase